MFLVLHVQPPGLLGRMALDLARELVADWARTLDLAPHARRYLEGGGKRLVQPLGWIAGCNSSLQELLVENNDVGSSDGCDAGHVWKSCNERRIDCRRS